jgi:tetratricopeptide (TPR) repeat protein
VARKKAPPAPPTRERVHEFLRRREFAKAVAAARECHRHSPSAETLTLLKQTIATAASFFAERDEAIEFTHVMNEADRIIPEDAGWAAERACLLAKGGRLADALMRADDAARPRVLGHAADRALRLQSKEFLPDDLHAGFDAIIAAFKKYEVGHDNAVRGLLEPIGLRSPFLEWKVLLRGLMAHAAGDDARAAENFGRLDTSRLPNKLSAPYRSAIDPSSKAALPQEAAAVLHKQYEKLNASVEGVKLREIACHLGRDKPLKPAFRALEGLLPTLKHVHPQLIPRLANCFYHAILHQGEPDDLARYRSLFGNPPDDPDFFKLQALICENSGALKQVHTYWLKYDEWLATKPPSWPAEMLARSRATVWFHLGENARLAEEEADNDVDAPLRQLFPTDIRPKKSEPLQPSERECFRRAAAFAPDWPDVVLDYFNTLCDEDREAEAETALRGLLKRKPDNLDAQAALGDFLQKQGRNAEAAEAFLRALAQNPLDKLMRRQTAYSILGHARSLLSESKANECLELLETQRALVQEFVAAGRDALVSVAAMKLGDVGLAAEACTRGLALPGMRLAVAYQVMVDSQLAKLKPKDRKAAETFFADHLAAPAPTPMEVCCLMTLYDMYPLQGMTYRGQKSHEKKILAQVNRCLMAEVPALEFELLGELLSSRGEWKLLKKLSDHCVIRFPKNPAFLLLRSEAGLNTNERMYSIERRLLFAKQLVEGTTEPRHRGLLTRIEELLKSVATPYELFDSFFGRSRR